MSTSYGGTPPGITGTHYGGSGLGVRGDAVPASGLDGPGYLYAGLSLPADAAKELRGPITRWPSGALTVYEDSSFDYSGDTDYALFALYVDGVASTTDIGYGAGIGRFDLIVGMPVSELGGGAMLDDGIAAGSMSSQESAIGGGAVLTDSAAAGALSSQESTLGGGVVLDDGVASGDLSVGISHIGGSVVLADAEASGGLSCNSASAADIWGYIMSNGHTAAENVVAIRAALDALTTTAVTNSVLAALNLATIPVDVQKMNGAEVIGTGVDGDPWRGVGVSP